MISSFTTEPQLSQLTSRDNSEIKDSNNENKNSGGGNIRLQRKQKQTTTMDFQTNHITVLQPTVVNQRHSKS